MWCMFTWHIRVMTVLFGLPCSTASSSPQGNGNDVWTSDGKRSATPERHPRSAACDKGRFKQAHRIMNCISLRNLNMFQPVDPHIGLTIVLLQLHRCNSIQVVACTMTQCRASITLLFEMMADWLCRTVDNHVLPMTFLQTFTGHEVGQDKEKCLDFKFAHWDDSAEIMIRFSFGTSQHRDRSLWKRAKCCQFIFLELKLITQHIEPAWQRRRKGRASTSVPYRETRERIMDTE